MNPSSPAPPQNQQYHQQQKPNVTQLTRPLYAPLEYKLRLALKSVSATVVRAYSLKSQQQKNEWMQNVVGDRAIIESWIDVEQLTGENTIQRVVERGIQVPEYGVRISSGQIHLGGENFDQENRELKLGTQLQQDPNQQQKKSWRPKKVHKLIHVWACVGRPFITEAKEGELVIPYGYDSVYLQPDTQQDASPDASRSLNHPHTLHSSHNNGASGPDFLNQSGEPLESRTTDEYHHKFIIYDSNKLFADYLVYLEYSPDGDESFKESLDMNRNDFAGFEEESTTGVLGLPTGEGNRRQSTLRSVTGLSYNNQIVQETYNRIIYDLEQKSIELEDDQMPVLMENDAQAEKVDVLKQQLDDIEMRREQICQNAMEVETQLREQFKRSLLQLHDITQLKLSKLCSTEVDLTRRIQEIQWMNDFIEYQKQILDPLSFVESYTHHSNLKEQIVQELDDPMRQAGDTIDTVVPDIQCSGSLKIESNTEHITDQMRDNRQVVLLNAPRSNHERSRLSREMSDQNQMGANNLNGSLDEDALKRGECVIS